jgi:hypothetical protein
MVLKVLKVLKMLNFQVDGIMRIFDAVPHPLPPLPSSRERGTVSYGRACRIPSCRIPEVCS